MEDVSFLFALLPEQEFQTRCLQGLILSDLLKQKGIPVTLLDLTAQAGVWNHLDRPEAYLKAAADQKSRSSDLISVLEAGIKKYVPNVIVMEGIRSRIHREVIEFLEHHHPGLRILVIDTRGQGQWIQGDCSIDSLDFIPLEELLAPYQGRPGALPEGFPTSPFSLGPVIPLYPGPRDNDDEFFLKMVRAEAAGCRAENTRRLGISFLGKYIGEGESDYNDSAKGVDLEALIPLLTPWFAQKAEQTIFSIQVQGDADVKALDRELDFLCENGLKFIEWLVPGPNTDLPKSLIWRASKLGIWNHAWGNDLFSSSGALGLWIANSPNIVHSFWNSAMADKQEREVRAAVQIPVELLAYKKTEPLPHLPFWQVLADPLAIMAALCRMERNTLLRLRADLVQNKTVQLGTRVDYVFKRPQEMDKETMDKIVAMVDAGGSVDITHVRANLEKAYLIGFAVEDGVIVGNSSLKHPRQVFINRLNKITGLDFTKCVERGYTSVKPEYRAMGIGAKLLEGLTQRADDVKVFSIISEENIATQKIALRNNTRKIAVYFSENLRKKMGVWMPEHMISGQIKEGQREGEP